MVFKVELAPPFGHSHALLHPGLEPLQEVAGEPDDGLRLSGQALLLPPEDLKHLGGGTASAVPEAKGDEGLVGKILLLEAVVGPGDHLGVGVRVVGRPFREGVVPPLLLCGEEVGRDRGPVDPPPSEKIIWHDIHVVPADLRGDEPVDTALFQDLRQRRRVSEDVGEPEDTGIDAELLFEEALSVDYLAYERLARRQVAVGLEPHRSLDLPPSGGDHLLYLAVKLGSVLFDRLVEIGLGGHEPVLGIALHKLDDGREGALRLLPRLPDRPEPGDVDVRVPDADGRRAVAPALRIEILLEPGVRRLHRFGKVLSPRLEEIHHRQGAAERGQRLHVFAGVLLCAFESPRRDRNIVPELLDFGVLRHDRQRKGCVGDPRAGVGVEEDVEGIAVLTRQVEPYLAVVGIDALAHDSVDKADHLRVAGVPATAVGRQEERGGRILFHAVRKVNVQSEPGVGIIPGPPSAAVFKGHKTLLRR